MMRQYKILNRCLKELNSSQLQTDKKLKMEVLLLQIKLVLLRREVESRLTGDAASEQVFLVLYDSVRRACNSYSQTETESLIGQLEKIKDYLNNSSELKRTNVEPGPDGRGSRLRPLKLTI
jgi:hypothetical protein